MHAQRASGTFLLFKATIMLHTPAKKAADTWWNFKGLSLVSCCSTCPAPCYFSWQLHRKPIFLRLVPVNKDLRSEHLAAGPMSAKFSSVKMLLFKKQGASPWDEEQHGPTSLYWNYFLVLFWRLRKQVLKMGCNLSKSNPTREAHANEHPEKPGLASGSAYTVPLTQTWVALLCVHRNNCTGPTHKPIGQFQIFLTT